MEGEKVKDGEQNEEIIQQEDVVLKRDGLTITHIRAYAVGHFNNDLCASMWFIYLNYYL